MIADCPTCAGEGTVEELVCKRANWRECCGGCVRTSSCVDCDGTGEVEVDDVEADDVDSDAVEAA